MSPFIDVHCHPTLKHYLYGYNIITKEPFGRKDNDYANICVTAPAMVEGQVQVVMGAHHLPEINVTKDWKLVHFSLGLLGSFLKKYLEKVEGNDAYQQTMAMIDDFEQQFNNQQVAIIAHTAQELEAALSTQKKIFIQIIWQKHKLICRLQKKFH